MTIRNVSDRLPPFVRTLEGFSGRWYRDPVGVGTIGVGFTWQSTAFREWWQAHKPSVAFGPGASMTRAEADNVLGILLDREYGGAVATFLGGAPVPQHVFDGMTSPVYNLGPGSLAWKWAAAAKSGDFKLAATRLGSTGITAKGKTLPGLVTRRHEEADLLALGDYDIAGQTMPDAMADGMLIRGERGAAVRDLQARLAALGFYDGAVDGLFGHGTEAAVLAAQERLGLKRDGYAGPKTLAALAAKENRPAVPPAAAGTALVVGAAATGAWALWPHIVTFFHWLFGG